MSLPQAVSAVRRAVRSSLEDVPPGSTVVVACSGGADSLALCAATVFEARAPGWYVVGVTVDHQLQEGSDLQAARVVQQMAALGVAETMAVAVDVRLAGQGPEAAARQARYAVLEEVAERSDAAAVLLGHTLDDQAETVLLGLARGSGGRSIAGMRRAFERFRRPLLDVTRAQTAQACQDEGIAFWNDPHNEDSRFLRVRVREKVLPLLEAELGPGVAQTLARTADLLRDDMELIDDLAEEAYAVVADPDGLDASRLAELHTGLRRRVIRRAALEAGSPAAELFHIHVVSVDRLVTHWRGQGPLHLPGHVTVRRVGDSLQFGRTAVAG